MEKPLAFTLGIITGFIFVFIITYIISRIARKKSGQRTNYTGPKYDERQLLARGRAYKAGFFTMIFYAALAGVLSDMYGIHLLMSFAGLWGGVTISLLVFITICIVNDAYMTLYENVRSVNLLFGIIIVANLIGDFGMLRSHVSLIEDGRLGIQCVNIMALFLLTMILILLDAKVLYDKFHDEGEDDI